MMDKLKAIWEKIKAFALSRRKRFYIILIVISSIVLLLDVSVRAFVPDLNRLSGFSQGSISFDTDVLTDGASSGDASTDQEAQGGSSDTSDAAGGGDMSLPDGTFSSGDAMQQGGGSMPGMSDSSDSAAASDSAASDGAAASDSTGSDTGGTDTGNAGGSIPSDGAAASDSASSGGMQGGFGDDMASGDAQMPDMSASTDGSTSDSDAFPGTDESSDAADDMTSFSGTVSIGWPLRILMGIRAAFLPILILALLVDACSIFLLVLVSRRERAAAEEAEKARIAEAFASDTQVHVTVPQQKKAKISPVTWILILAAIIVLLLIVKVLSSATGTEASETEATVYEASAESGDISVVLPGTGTLTEEDAVEVSLPSEVEIMEWYVSDGDTVAEGDVLAAVDTASALSAIASVQEVITSLDEALTELEDSDTTDTVTAAASGRVKAVYADEDDDVLDTIYDSGSLMVLSLDGLMAVSFETESEVSVGDEVTVALSDDTEVDGTVESVLEGTVVVTLTDEDTVPGDSVTVTDADGNVLGSGELYIHSELQVFAFSGTVSSVSVEEEDEVSAGDTLLSLTDVDNTFEAELLVEQREELEAQIQTLFGLYQDGYLYAEAAGVVSGISSSTSDASADATAASGESDSEQSATESSTQTTGSVYYSTGSNIVSASYTDESTGISALTTAQGIGGVVTAAQTDTVSDAAAAESTASDTTDSTDSDDSTSSGSDTDSSSTDDSTSSGSGSDDSSSSDSMESTYVNYMAIVTGVSDGTAAVTLYALSGSLSDSGELTSSGTASVSLSTTVYVSSDGTLTAGSASDIAAGSTLILICSADDTVSDGLSPICVIAITATDSTTAEESQQDTAGTDSTGSTDQSGTQQDSKDQSGTQQGSTDQSGSQMQGSTDDASAMTGSSDMTAADTTGTDTSALTDASAAETSVTETLTEEVSATYSVDETTLLSITPQDYVYVTITVDELDILSLSAGLEAQVTLDAFPGQSFTGVVESIDTSGTNEGGNSKYTAVVRIDRGENMLAGMNASVKITLETVEDVLSIPAEAIVEDADGTYVYTSYDEKTDTLGDPVEVETGVSDGTNVEIVSGLSAGDTYWYSVLDTVNYSTSSSSSSMTFSFGGGFGGGGF